jgi:hypothetical protein
MKKNIFSTVLLLLFLVSCNSNLKQKEVVVNELKTWGNLSEIEIKGYDFKYFKTSDRDAYTWLADFYSKQAREDASYSAEAANYAYKEVEKYNSLIEKSQGNLEFYKIEFYKVETDTIHKGIIILNDKNVVVFKRSFK